jgi:hypothetical protein
MAYCDLCHHDDEVCLFNGQFLNGVLIGSSLALEYYLECISRHALGLLDLVLQGLDLRVGDSTLSDGSTSTWKTSPLRFFTESFI